MNPGLLMVPPGGGPVHNVLGAPYRFLLTSDATAGAFALIESTAPANSGVPLHLHTHEDETFYVLEGTMEVQADGRTVMLEENASAFLPRGKPHSYRNPAKAP